MEIGNSFYQQLLDTTALEFIAVITGILSVWYGKKEHILIYPFGIVNVAIFIYITYNYGLYAETGIYSYYLIMSIYGWWNWKNTQNSVASQIPITKSNRRDHVIYIASSLMAFTFVYLLLIRFTDSNVPILDAITTSLAVTAMYLMALKKIEHWLFWIACDLISIPLYIYKGLPFSSFQFLIFTYIAILGWISWRKKLRPNLD